MSYEKVLICIRNILIIIENVKNRNHEGIEIEEFDISKTTIDIFLKVNNIEPFDKKYFSRYEDRKISKNSISIGLLLPKLLFGMKVLLIKVFASATMIFLIHALIVDVVLA